MKYSEYDDERDEFLKFENIEEVSEDEWSVIKGEPIKEINMVKKMTILGVVVGIVFLLWWWVV